MEAFAIYARLLAEMAGVKVVLQPGVTPSTDGKTIWIDGPPNGAVGRALTYGKILHEGGHVTESTFGPITTLPQGNVRHLAGILEDVRMESAQCKKFKGARHRLKEMVEGLVNTGYFKPPKGDTTPANCLFGAMLYGLRHRKLGQDAVAEYAEQAYRHAEIALTGPVVGRVMAMAEQVDQCQSTHDVVELAKAIARALQEEQERLEQESTQTSSSDQQGQDPSQSQNDQGSGSQAQGEGDPQSSSGDPQAQTDQEPASQAQGDGDSQSLSADPQAQGSAAAKALGAIVNDQDVSAFGDLGDTLDQAIQQQVAEHGVDTSAVGGMPTAHLQTDLGTGANVIARVRRDASALRRKIHNLFEAQSQSTIEIGRRGKRLASGKLIRVAVGNPRIWEQEHQGQRLNTAVQLLLDASASMGRTIHLARDATLATYDALSRIDGIAAGAATFPGKNSHVDVLARIGEPARKAYGRFASVRADGGTPLAEALMFAGMELAPRPEERKIVLVATDGQPHARSVVLKWIALLQEQGIELMGIGIGVDVSELFRTSCSIRSTDELPGAMFRMLKGMLANGVHA